MKLSLKHLSTYLPFQWEKEVLTTAGLEVDEVIEFGVNFSGVFVGRVLSINPHPNADRLQCCLVDAGDQGHLEIICGAKNVQVDQYYPVAKVGAILPGNFKIKKSKIRGEISFGMLCSEKELGFDFGLEGIWNITSITEDVGRSLESVVDFSDQAYVFDLTPNRGDCLSYLGIAREIAALYDEKCHFDLFNQTVDLNHLPDVFSLQIDEPKACPNYVGVLIEGVDNTVNTPFEIACVLYYSGIRVTNNLIVDITNYVMIVCGQPLHAFDQSFLGEKIGVRYSKKNESIRLLNDQLIHLESDSLLVVSDQKPVALAGVMGDVSTVVSKKTRSIWLESAFFSPVVIAGQARRFGLKSDSAYRFERGVDFTLQQKAAGLAAKLIVQFCGGRISGKNICCDESFFPSRLDVDVSASQINQLLGSHLGRDQMVCIFNRFGMQTQLDENVISVQPPSYRFDIESLSDLAEEVARVIGYDQIESQSVMLDASYRLNMDFNSSLVDVLGEVLVGCGYQQSINYSFIALKYHQLFCKDLIPVELLNPIHSEQSVMRGSLLLGLLGNVQYNLNRQQYDLRFYEFGKCFLQKEADQFCELEKIAGVCLVPPHAHKTHWLKSPVLDFFEFKGHLERLLSFVNQKIRWVFGDHSYLIPGQSALLFLEDQLIGFAGLLKEDYLSVFEIEKKNCFAFELDTQALSLREPSFKKLSKYPSNRRDISLFVNKAVRFSDMLEVIDEQKIRYLKEIFLLDCYQDDVLDGDTQSLTLGLIVEADKTLKSSEINEVIQKVMLTLENRFQAKQRIS